MRLLALLVALWHFGCSDQAPRCSIPPPSLPDWRVTADHDLLRDSLGRSLILRGVNAGGRSKFAPYVPFDFADGQYDAALASYLDRAQSWGASVLRVPITWAAVEPTQGADDEQFLQRFDALVDGAWARGLRTVIDFHQDIYAENFCGDGFPGWTIPDPKPAPHHDCPQWYDDYGTAPVTTAFDAFWAAGSTVRTGYDALWDRLAARYQNRPGVIAFELFNEPFGGSQEHVTFEKTTLTKFFSDEIARLRAAAPSTLIVFEPPGLDSATQLTALGGQWPAGAVFAPHYYQATTLLPTGDGNPDGVAAAIQAWRGVGDAMGVPTFLGEFGTGNQADNGTEYLDAHYAALDQAWMSSTEWEYSVAAEAWNAEGFGLVGADGTETATVDALARPYARAVAGSQPTTSFVAATRTWSMSWTSDGGVTEISLPARYSKNPSVKLSGTGCVDLTQPNLLLVRASTGAALTLTIAPR